jgi:type II secretory ATPase GspE/PulE/Tfp pilus assembly ATPase PilB-like protein
MSVDPKSSLEDFRALAKEQGMRTLFEEGAVAVLSGVTSIEEMLRVCTLED